MKTTRAYSDMTPAQRRHYAEDDAKSEGRRRNGEAIQIQGTKSTNNPTGIVWVFPDGSAMHEINVGLQP